MDRPPILEGEEHLRLSKNVVGIIRDLKNGKIKNVVGTVRDLRGDLMGVLLVDGEESFIHFFNGIIIIMNKETGELRLGILARKRQWKDMAEIILTGKKESVMGVLLVDGKNSYTHFFNGITFILDKELGDLRLSREKIDKKEMLARMDIIEELLQRRQV